MAASKERNYLTPSLRAAHVADSHQRHPGFVKIEAGKLELQYEPVSWRGWRMKFRKCFDQGGEKGIELLTEIDPKLRGADAG